MSKKKRSKPQKQKARDAMSNMKSREGHHTTTQAVMVPLPQVDGTVVDTPGIKDMGLLGLHPDDLLDLYPDIAEFAVQCHFSDCSHDHEPGCMVKAALADGRITPWRLDNYVNLYAQLESDR